MRNIYEIGPIDLGESDRFDRFATKELHSYGDSLAELIDNATYSYIDQDGGEILTDVADDNDAIMHIEEYYRLNKCPEMEFIADDDPLSVDKEYTELKLSRED